MRILILLIFMVFVSCRHSAKPAAHATEVLHKILISRDQVYDLSGYAGGGGADPFNLFDENALVDPANETTDQIIPVTNCQPVDHASIYFPKNTGSRIVIDFKKQRSVGEIYLYDRSLTTDSVFLYTGNLLHWKAIDSLETNAKKTDWGWRRIIMNDSTRYMMIRFSGYHTMITEMVVYGSAKPEVSEPQPVTFHKGFTKSVLGNFVGVNYIMETEPRWLKPFHFNRLYNFAMDYDDDTTRDASRVRFNMLHYGRYDRQRKDYVFDIDSIQKSTNGEIFYSIRGVSKWMSLLGETDKDRPTNLPGMNPEDPASYSRHAEMMWHLSAFFGYSKIDTLLLSLSHEPRTSGRGSMHVYENGNEEDANWVGDRYCNPVEYFAQSSADWDGNERKLGRRSGIAQADPDAQLMMSGLTGLDTNRVKVCHFLSVNLRSDHEFIWKGGVQYHYYAHKDGRGISPEQDSMRWRLSRVAEFTHRLVPGVPCILGENGYDKSPRSGQSTPGIAGLSSAQSQGVMLLRSINAAFFSGFDAYILFWLRDSKPPDDPEIYQTCGLLRTLPDGTTKAYPAWYYISTMVSQLGDYRADKIISEYGDLCIYRYRNALHPDSLALFVFKKDPEDRRKLAMSLQCKGVADSVVKIISFSDDDPYGQNNRMSITGSWVNLMVTEKPVLIFYKQRPSGQ